MNDYKSKMLNRAKANTPYLQNVLKSMGVSFDNVLKDISPNLHDSMSFTKNASKDIIKGLRVNRNNTDRIKKAIEDNRALKIVKDGYANLKSDLKSGNFHNDRDGVMGGGFDNFDDVMTSLDDIDWGDGEVSNDIDINLSSNGDTSQSASILRDGFVQSTDAILETGRLGTETMIVTSAQMMLSNKENTEKIIGELSNINSSISALVEYNNNNMTRFIEASTGYYETILKEKDVKYKESNSPFGLDGKLSMANYFKSTKKKLKDATIENTLLTTTLDMLQGIVAGNPMAVISESLIKAVVPGVAKKGFTKMDENFAAAINSILGRIDSSANNYDDNSFMGGLKRTLGKIFGHSDKLSAAGPGEVRKSVVGWDGTSKHTLEHIIPTYLRESNAYLREIATTLSNKRDVDILSNSRVYDWNDNKFINKKEVDDIIHGRMYDEIKSSFRDSKFGEAMTDRAGRINMTDKDRATYEHMMDTLFTNMTLKSKFMNVKEDKDILDMMSNIVGPDNLRDVMLQSIKELGPTAALDIANVRTKTKQSLNSRLEQLLGEDLVRSNLLNANLDVDRADQNIMRYMTSVNPNVKNSKVASVQSTVSGTYNHKLSLIDYVKEIRDMMVQNRVGQNGTGQNGTGQNTISNNGIILPSNALNPIIQNSSNTSQTQYDLSRLKPEDDEDFIYPTDGYRTRFDNSMRSKFKSVNTFLYDMAFGSPSSAVQGLSSTLFQSIAKTLGNINTSVITPSIKHILGVDKDTSLLKLDLMSTIKNRFSDISNELRFRITGRGYTDTSGKTINNLSDEDMKDTVSGQLKSVFNFVGDGMKTYIFGDNFKSKIPKGIITSFKDNIALGMSEWTGALLGFKPDESDPTKTVEEQRSEMITKYKDGMKKHVPDAIVGGLLGAGGGSLIGGVALGPLGAALGATINIARKSEKFNEILFGKEVEEDGVKKKIGGIISDKIQKTFKDNGKAIVGGGMVGAIKYGLLGSGVAGAIGSAVGGMSGLGLLGSIIGGPLVPITSGIALGMLKNSESFKKMMFGEDIDDNGVIKHVDGLLSNILNKTGLTDGKKAFRMGGLGLAGGLLAGLFSPLGPVGTSLIGIAGLSSGLALSSKNISNRVEEFIFGSENDDGSKNKDGIIHRLSNFITTNIAHPIQDSMSFHMKNIGDYVKTTIGDSLKYALTPFHNTFIDISDSIKNKLGLVFDNFTNDVKNKLKDFGLSGLSKIISGAVRGVSGFIGGTAELPFKIANKVGEKLAKSAHKSQEKRKSKIVDNFLDSTPEGVRLVAAYNSGHMDEEEFNKQVEINVKNIYKDKYSSELLSWDEYKTNHDNAMEAISQRKKDYNNLKQTRSVQRKIQGTLGYKAGFNEGNLSLEDTIAAVDLMAEKSISKKKFKNDVDKEKAMQDARLKAMKTLGVGADIDPTRINTIRSSEEYTAAKNRLSGKVNVDGTTSTNNESNLSRSFDDTITTNVTPHLKNIFEAVNKLLNARDIKVNSFLENHRDELNEDYNNIRERTGNKIKRKRRRRRHFTDSFDSFNGGILSEESLDDGAREIDPDNIDGHADGTHNANRGLKWVGENGPELLMLRGGEKIIPNKDSMKKNPMDVTDEDLSKINPKLMTHEERIVSVLNDIRDNSIGAIRPDSGVKPKKYGKSLLWHPIKNIKNKFGDIRDAIVDTKNDVFDTIGGVKNGILDKTSKIRRFFSNTDEDVNAVDGSLLDSHNNRSMTNILADRNKNDVEKENSTVNKIDELIGVQEKHSTVWNSIFSKKGLITGGIILAVPLLIKLMGSLGITMDGIGETLGNAMGVISSIVENGGNLFGGLGKMMTKEKGAQDDRTSALDASIDDAIWNTGSRMTVKQFAKYEGKEAGKNTTKAALKKMGVSTTDDVVKATAKTSAKKVVVKKVTKSSAAKITTTAIKSTAKSSSDDVVKGAMKTMSSTISKKISTKAGKVVGKFGDDIVKILSKLSTKLATKLKTGLAVAAGKIAGEAATAGIVTAGFLVLGGLNGADGAAKLFYIDKDDVDEKMVLIATVLGALAMTGAGSIFDIACAIAREAISMNGGFLDPIHEIAKLIYNAMSDEDDGKKLDTSIADFKKVYDEYFDKNMKKDYETYKKVSGNNISFEEFQSRVENDQLSTTGQSYIDFNETKNAGFLDKAFNAMGVGIGSFFGNKETITDNQNRVFTENRKGGYDVKQNGKDLGTVADYKDFTNDKDIVDKHTEKSTFWKMTLPGIVEQTMDADKKLAKVLKDRDNKLYKYITLTGKKEKFDEDLDKLKEMFGGKKKKDSKISEYKKLSDENKESLFMSEYNDNDKAWMLAGTTFYYRLSTSNKYYNKYTINDDMVATNIPLSEVEELKASGMLIEYDAGKRKSKTSLKNTVNTLKNKLSNKASNTFESISTFLTGIKDSLTDNLTSQTVKGGTGSNKGGYGDIPYLSQNDPRWASSKYKESGGFGDDTISSRGCGPTSMAMVLNGIGGKGITPKDTAKFAQDNGYSDETGTNWKFMNDADKNFGIDKKSTYTPNKSFLSSELNKGRPVILSGQDVQGGYGNSPFTPSGHYVVATKMDNRGNVNINDPRGTDYSGAYNMDDVLNKATAAWSFGKKTKGGMGNKQDSYKLPKYIQGGKGDSKTYNLPYKDLVVISQRQHSGHHGIDMYSKGDLTLYSLTDGTVIFADFGTDANHHNRYGNCVDIQSSNGQVYRYAHLSKLMVKQGDIVKRGTVIGIEGNTGESKGSHLHLEVLKDGSRLNVSSVTGIPDTEGTTLTPNTNFSSTYSINAPSASGDSMVDTSSTSSISGSRTLDAISGLFSELGNKAWETLLNPQSNATKDLSSTNKFFDILKNGYYAVKSAASSNNNSSIDFSTLGGDYIGRHIKEFESGDGGPTTISKGVGDPGGVSFGTFQMMTKNNSVLPAGQGYSLYDFWNKYYADKFGGKPGNNEDFKNKWLTAAKSDPNFQTNEARYMYDNYYKVMKPKVTVGPNGRSRAIQEALMSTAIQYGPNTPIWNNNITSDFRNKSDAELITALSDAKVRSFNGNSPRHKTHERNKLLGLTKTSPIVEGGTGGGDYKNSKVDVNSTMNDRLRPAHMDKPGKGIIRSEMERANSINKTLDNIQPHYKEIKGGRGNNDSISNKLLLKIYNVLENIASNTLKTSMNTQDMNSRNNKIYTSSMPSIDNNKFNMSRTDILAKELAGIV